MDLSNLQTRICVNGKPIKVYHDEKGMKWIEARDKNAYTIEIKNNSSAKVLAVVSVDGINVINGKQAEMNPEGGYIIEPYSKIDVEGWRISDEAVKEFLFTFNKNDSYSVKLGADAANTGIIGVAFYRTKELEKDKWFEVIKEIHHYHFPYWWYYPWYWDGPYTTWCSGPLNGSNIKFFNSGSTSAVYCSNETQNNASNISFSVNCAAPKMSDSDGFQAGTGKGEEIFSKMKSEDLPDSILIGVDTIYYDSYANLEAKGIIQEKSKMPQAFKNTGYCPDV